MTGHRLAATCRPQQSHGVLPGLRPAGWPDYQPLTKVLATAPSSSSSSANGEDRQRGGAHAWIRHSRVRHTGLWHPLEPIHSEARRTAKPSARPSIGRTFARGSAGRPPIGQDRDVHEGGCAVASSVSRDDLPVEKIGDYESRSTELDDFTISFESTPAGFAPPHELFKGLPDDACPCPHWGVLLKGEHRITYTDGTVETIRAGEAYLRPGHWFESVADSEAVEFSPTETLRATVEVVQRIRSLSPAHADLSA